MSRFNTGNPLGSGSPLDLDDNAKNMDEAVNAPQDTFQDRLGKSRLTWAGIVKAGSGDPAIAVDAADRAVDAADRAEDAEAGVEQNAEQIAQDAAQQAVASVVIEVDVAVDRADDAANRAEAARDAAFVNADVYADIATGHAAVVEGEQFQVVEGDEIVRYRRDTSASTEVARYPSASITSLTVNRGKDYPLRKMMRGGVTSSASSIWNGLILDAKVSGAIHGEVYRIAYQQNGALISGKNEYNWIIHAYDESTYELDGTAIVILSSGQAGQQQIDRGAGIQTIILYPPARPGMIVTITIDASNLPAEGAAINAQNTSNSAGSWIIDKSRYEYSSDSGEEQNSITINYGKVSPFKVMERNEQTSAASDFLLNSILDVKVVGARPGYYYAIRYFANGVNLPGAYEDGWMVEEVLSDGYSESQFSNASQKLINITDYAPEIDPTIGIQTVRLDAPGRNLQMYITVDPSRFPARGSAVILHNDNGAINRPGSTWIIDPACYFSEGGYAPIPGGGSAGSVEYSIDGSGQALIKWKSSDRYFRWGFGPNGANSLPNFSSVASSQDGVVFNTISSFSTDWLPPLIFNVDAEAPVEQGSALTGGNHTLFDQVTARNVLYQIYADGSPVEFGSSGSCEKVTVLISNELMAANTVLLGRYALRQSFVVEFTPGVAEVSSCVKAIEGLGFQLDQGPQLVSTGLGDSILFAGGMTKDRVPFTQSLSSGPSSTYPDAWAVILQSGNGQLSSWMDRTYGVGTGDHVADTNPRIRVGGGTSTKVYHAAILNEANPLHLSAGESYKWRGGYALQSPNVESAGFDSLLRFSQDGSTRMTWVIDANDYVVMP